MSRTKDQFFSFYNHRYQNMKYHKMGYSLLNLMSPIVILSLLVFFFQFCFVFCAICHNGKAPQIYHHLIFFYFFFKKHFQIYWPRADFRALTVFLEHSNCPYHYFFCSITTQPLCSRSPARNRTWFRRLIRWRDDVYGRNVCDLRICTGVGEKKARPPPIEYKTLWSNPSPPLSVTWLGAAALAVKTQKHRWVYLLFFLSFVSSERQSESGSNDFLFSTFITAFYVVLFRRKLCSVVI